MNFGDLQIAAFVDNLTDSHTVTNYNWTIDYGGGPGSRLRAPVHVPSANHGPVVHLPALGAVSQQRTASFAMSDGERGVTAGYGLAYIPLTF